MAAKVTKSATAVDRQVGQLIRAARLRRDLSQTQLGDALGISFQQIQKYEKGTNRVGASRMTQIASTLQIPVEDLFPAPGKLEKEPAERLLMLQDRRGNEIAALWPQLPVKQRQVIAELIKAIIAAQS